VAVRDVNLTLDTPGIVTILGPNGAGKTTLMKIMTGISRATSGSILVNTLPITDNLAKVLGYMGTLVEQPEFYPYLKGQEILEFICRIRGMSMEAARIRIKEIGELTGCSAYLDRKAGGYSRGMKQRLGLAAALVHDPEIIILDEPTFGLDPRGMFEIRNILKELNRRREKIILLSTHLIQEAKEISDRVIIMNNGSVVKDMRNEEKNLLKIRIIGGASSLNPSVIPAGFRVDDEYIISESVDDVPAILKRLMDAGIKFDRVQEYNDLEEIYLKNVNVSVR
jgi:ABC-2 type transport system ATP-binding protein